MKLKALPVGIGIAFEVFVKETENPRYFMKIEGSLEDLVIALTH